MTIEQAITEVEKLLAEFWRPTPEHGKVKLYTWGDPYTGDEPTVGGFDPSSKLSYTRHPAVGFRVAEVSFEAYDPETHLGGGSSFMQVDPGNGGEACFYAERCVIARIEGWDAREVIDEDWRLVHVVHGPDEAKPPRISGQPGLGLGISYP